MTQNCKILTYLCLTEHHNVSDICDMIYEDIDSQYGYVKLCNNDIPIMKSNGFINMTKFYEAYHEDFNEWLTEENSQSQLKSMSSKNKPASITITEGEHMIRGIYIHSKLIPYAVSCCKVCLALLVTDTYLPNYKTYTKRIESINKVLKEKDQIIDKLEKKVFVLTRKSMRLKSKRL